jgi:hypothetical protein
VGFRFTKGTQNRSNQEQYHILLAEENQKTARESLLTSLCPAGAVTALLLTKAKNDHNNKNKDRQGMAELK